MGVLAGFAPIESTGTTSHIRSIQSFALSASVWPQFKCQFMTQNSTPRWRVGGGHRGSKIMYQAKSRPNIPIQFLYTSLSCAAWSLCTTRQTDRQTYRRQIGFTTSHRGRYNHNSYSIPYCAFPTEMIGSLDPQIIHYNTQDIYDLPGVKCFIKLIVMTVF